MFYFEKKSHYLPFFSSIKIGVFIPEIKIKVCMAEYDINYYDDSLFNYFSIPFPEAISNSVFKRRAEYIAGRFVTKELLRKNNCHDHVYIAEDRSPLWPKGWCGSISHTNKYVVSIVADFNSGLKPGVDIEEINFEIMDKTNHLFVADDERRYLKKLNIDYHLALQIVFSAKESLYKSIYPEVKFFFDFDAAKIVDIDTCEGSFILKLDRNLSNNLKKGVCIKGRYILIDGNVVTLIS